MPDDASTAVRESIEDELHRLQSRNEELELLYESIRDLTTTLSEREVLERLMERTLGHLDSEIGSILLIGPDGRLCIVVARGLPKSVVDATRLEIGDGISGCVAQSGRALLVTDIEKDARFRRRNHERYYTRSCISAPLLHQRAVRGVININNKRSREPFVLADLRFLEAIAGHASVALANAHRFEEVLERAQRDALTGLANHGHFWSTLDMEHQRARRYGHSLSVVMLDVDHFKAFNDRHGHPAGDQALRSVARILETKSRSHDLVARYGGEEFAVILPETPLEGAHTFAENIRTAVEDHRFGPDQESALTLSAGVATIDNKTMTAQCLVEKADERLYKAKELGRNRVCCS
jgi:diguanylate cyclase (GGDEF)-like protein